VVVAIDKSPLPSKVPEPVTEPVKEIVLAVANLVAVSALPPKTTLPLLSLYTIHFPVLTYEEPL